MHALRLILSSGLLCSLTRGLICIPPHARVWCSSRIPSCRAPAALWAANTDTPAVEDEQLIVAKQIGSLRGLTGSTFSLAAGLAGLTALLINRVALTPFLYDTQGRTDLLALIACGTLIMQGVYLLVSFVASLSLLTRFSRSPLVSDLVASAVHYDTPGREHQNC